MDALTILSHPARIRAVSDADTLMARLGERYALEPNTEVYLWRAEISNDLLDSHFTHMAESTLRNYAADAQAGVAFLKGHDWRALPIGYSLDATYEEGERKRVVADFYTVAGLPETDDLIKRMKAGILRDVSVGFHGGTMTCDLCSRDFWSCPHIPGLKYETKEGDTVRTQLATFTIEDARLSEVSGVFDGSTPGAMILKAQERAGDLTPDQVRILEQRYRVKLPAGKRVFAGVEIPTGQMPGKADDMHEDEVKRIQAVFARAGVDDPGDIATSIEQLGSKLDEATKRVNELTPQAADGRQYRSDLVAEALAEGVRAQGQDFDKPTYEAMLANAPIATIKRMRDDWKKIGDERFQGGRQSVDESTAPDEQVEAVAFMPDSAFRG